MDNQPSTLTVTISPTGLNGNKTSPVPPPPPPAVTLPEENEDPDKRWAKAGCVCYENRIFPLKFQFGSLFERSFPTLKPKYQW